MLEKQLLVKIGIGAAGSGVGAGVMLLACRGYFKRKYENITNEEIASVKKTYALLRKEGPYSDPATAVEAYKDRVDELGYAAELATHEAVEESVEDTIDSIAQNEKVKIRSIFDDALAKRDYATLDDLMPPAGESDPERFDVLAARDPEHPFVITLHEFAEFENEFSKITITYYEGDNTLCDERDAIIPDVENTVGAINLNKFGQESDDINIVYIRNERLRTDFEVVRDEGTYTEEVLGIRESAQANKIYKMRDDE